MKKFKPSQIDLQVNFIKQGKSYVAYSPSLDLSTCGKTLKEAQLRLEEAVEIFIEEKTKSNYIEFDGI